MVIYSQWCQVVAVLETEDEKAYISEIDLIIS